MDEQPKKLYDYDNLSERPFALGMFMGIETGLSVNVMLVANRKTERDFELPTSGFKLDF